MKKSVFLFGVVLTTILILSSNWAVAQSDNLKWKYAHTASSGSVSRMLTDSYGNVYVIGTFSRDQFEYNKRSVRGASGLEEKNVFILKAESTGRPIFLYSIMSLTPGGDITPGMATINDNGELALAFYADETAAFQMGKYVAPSEIDRTNAYLAKFSKTGIIRWVHALKTDMDTLPEVRVKDMFLDEAGSLIYTGFFKGFSMQVDDKTIEGTDYDAMLFLGRIDPRGEVPWLVNCPYNTSMDNGEIWGTHLCKTSADFFYLAGYHENYRPFYFGSDSIYNAWSTDAFLALYTGDGNSSWVRSFRGDSLEFIEKLSVTEENDVVVLGMSNSAALFFDGSNYSSMNGNYDLFVARYNPGGGLMSSTNITTQMSYRKDYEENAFMKVNGAGNILICSEFSGNEVFEDVHKLVNTENGSRDLMFARLDGNTMEPIWTNQGSAPGNNYYDDVFFDNNGNVFIAGTSYNLLDIEGQVIEGDIKDGSPYLAKVQPSGELDYSYWQPNSTDYHINIREVASDNFGNSYVAGSFSGTTPILDDQPLVGPELSGFFIAKYGRVKDIEGNVIDNEGNPVFQGYVKIYGHTMYQRSPVVDSVELSANGEFIFKDVPHGEYILVAIPEQNADLAVVTTYYPQEEYWEPAGKIKVDAFSGPHYYTIEMIQAPVFEGGTLLEGGVVELDSSDMFKRAASSKGKPSQKATVVLVGNKKHKSTWEIVAIVETNADGSFSFQNVEDGSYLLYVDYPGLPVENAWEIEISGHQYVSSLNYFVDEEKVYAEGLAVYSSIKEQGANPDIQIYPNPATDYIDIELKTGQRMVIDLFDVNGKQVNHIATENPARLILANQPPGTYFLRITTVDTVYFEKISVN